MIKGGCIYCKKEKDLNREHAFPKSLLQKGAPEWIIDKHLCKTCNSNLGKLDAVLSRRSHIAFVWDRMSSQFYPPATVGGWQKRLAPLVAVPPTLDMREYSKKP